MRACGCVSCVRVPSCGGYDVGMTGYVDPSVRPLEPHPLAAAFPAPSDDEYQALAASVAADGVRTPVVVWDDRDGRTWMLDGIHRQRAAIAAGRTLPYTQVAADTDPVREIVALNVARRHLRSGQRAALADRYSADSAVGGVRKSDGYARAHNNLTQDDAAGLMGVHRSAVSRILRMTAPAVRTFRARDTALR